MPQIDIELVECVIQMWLLFILGSLQHMQIRGVHIYTWDSHESRFGV